MKKQKNCKTTMLRVAEKRAKRALKSRAKKAHRNGTGYKDMEEES